MQDTNGTHRAKRVESAMLESYIHSQKEMQEQLETLQEQLQEQDWKVEKLEIEVRELKRK